MSTTHINNPTSRLRFGLGRTEITPPVGIYHRMWGAARHDRATGVHRPLVADVLALAPLDGGEAPLLRAQIDLVGLGAEDYAAVVEALAGGAGVPLERVVAAFNHSHAAGFFVPDRRALPGGELIAGYLEALAGKLREAARAAVGSLREAAI